VYYAEMLERPRTEVWFRNAGLYIQQLAEIGTHNVVFDRAYAAKRRINPRAFCTLYFGVNAHWRALVIAEQYTTLYEAGSNEPQAVYPTWSAKYGTWSGLRKLILKPWSQREELYDVTRPKEQIPSKRQQHIIVITDIPNLRDKIGSIFIDDLSQMQADYPDVTFFIHGLYSYRAMFGLNFKMVDVDSRTHALKGQIFHPGGKLIYPEDLYANQYWAQILGFQVTEIRRVPANKCLYNIKSALFAGSYFKTLKKFAVRKSNGGVDWNTPRMEAYIKENNVIFTKRLVTRPGDRLVCDDCSLWLSCKLYREGAICAVPNSEMKKVAELFGTRDAQDIIKGLTKLTQVNVERIESALADEATSENEGPNPALNKLMADTFKMGHELLKIVDPSQRAGKPAVNVNVGAGGGTVEITQGGDERTMVAQVYKLLEARGYARDEITEDLVKFTLNELANPSDPRVIEGHIA
jgi:hypothetical protein